MSRNEFVPTTGPYRSGLRKPTRWPSFWFIRATSPAQSGATALVPPITNSCPSTRTAYPVTGSASPATSGTPRPFRPPGFFETGTPAAAWYAGTPKTSLTPPPVALVAGFSFQTVSLVMAAPAPTSFVPPQPSANGLEAGKSACCFPSAAPSPEPPSPDAQQTVTPRAAAVWNAWSKFAIAWPVQFFSGLPQLIEMTDGLWAASWVAIVIASRNPLIVFGAKYTAIFAFGATAAATSMSSITSPSSLSGVEGRFLPPSTRTA